MHASWQIYKSKEKAGMVVQPDDRKSEQRSTFFSNWVYLCVDVRADLIRAGLG